MVIPGEGGGHVVLRTLISVLRWQGVQIGLDMFMGSILGEVMLEVHVIELTGLVQHLVVRFSLRISRYLISRYRESMFWIFFWLLFKRDRILSLDHATNDNREWQQIPWMPNPQRGGLWSTLTCILKWRFLLTLVSTHK